MSYTSRASLCYMCYAAGASRRGFRGIICPVNGRTTMWGIPRRCVEAALEASVLPHKKDTADGRTCEKDAPQCPEAKTISLEQAATLAAGTSGPRRPGGLGTG